MHNIFEIAHQGTKYFMMFLAKLTKAVIFMPVPASSDQVVPLLLEKLETDSQQEAVHFCQKHMQELFNQHLITHKLVRSAPDTLEFVHLSSGHSVGYKLIVEKHVDLSSQDLA